MRVVRRVRGRLFVALIASLFLLGAAGGVGMRTSTARAVRVRHASVASRPNVLLVVADDQTDSTFNRTIMPNVFSKLVDQGVQFDRGYVNPPGFGCGVDYDPQALGNLLPGR